jgi:hypothetical protein
VADDLLKPTITETPQPLRRPWRVDSLVYPAFFGGPLAVTYVGAINARRLGVGNRQIALIVATGAAALVAQLMVVVFLLDELSTGVQRLSFSVAGIIVWSVAKLVQQRPFRIFLLRGGEPASLWGVGIGVVLASAAIELILISILSTAVR